MANIHDESTWGNLPQDVLTKLIQFKNMITKEDEIRCATCNAITCTCGEEF